MNKFLTIEEITSVTRTTEHGVERLFQRVFSPEEIISLKSSPDIVKLLPDGAKVFIKEVSGKYTLLVEGEQGIVTALKNISEKSLNKLVKNYEWT